ncbi:MAG TPA: alpha-glucan family phosphorylase [Anaerolineae bacterium]|nr:alpha-glucan family phosphorylase [Anaerolineae bacterium]MCB9106011.1 alpha-glucan family phosphorylase [Anaerolineales bacterium]HRV95656.1 alpha-glucan family phosphorylase [Anaerolineae bacterium]
MKTVGFTPIPERINRITDVAYNLWWSWHPEAQELFKMIDAQLWEDVYHNPVLFLSSVRQSDLDKAANNADFIKAYHEVLIAFDKYQVYEDTWFKQTYPDKIDKPIAYFSAEFGLHECLPIYSGGLGILSGDHTKEASDLGLPFIGVGFLYPQGYFRQVITHGGDQEAIYTKVRFAEVPALPAFTPDGKEIVVSVSLPARNNLPDRQVYAKVYKIQVGIVPLYLMDTDIHPNAEPDRELSARLYGGDEEMRLAQEMVLGIGGVRALRKLGIEPAVWHMNEGHSAFMVLERAREMVDSGKTFKEAADIIRKSSVFTTHTPVPAGHDAFPFHMMDRYFPTWHEDLKISREDFLDLARQDQSWGPSFSMTVLALKLSGRANGVSKLHGDVSRKMWNWLWPSRNTDDVPITYVTNGIHTETWLAPELKTLFDQQFGSDWTLNIDDQAMWNSIMDVPDEEIWDIMNQLRARLVDFIRLRTRQRMIRLGMHPNEIQSVKNLFNPKTLTIGFARRFATYKRATLIFHDTERLKRIVHGSGGGPVQFVFSGKAHPRDEPGKNFIREVYYRSHEAGLAGHLIFIEDYDMNVSRNMLAGADVWMNTPRRPMEASGTSGEKAALNGSPNFSILDGWWDEAYNGKNGWSIGDVDAQYNSEYDQNHADATSIYETLEQKLVPAFYNRGDDGIPHEWVQHVKESIRTVAPQFSMTRMIKDYTNDLYVPSME